MSGECIRKMEGQGANGIIRGGSLQPEDDAAKFLVVLYYKYVRLAETNEEIQRVGDEHRALCESLQLTGRVRIAKEGINGTLAGNEANVRKYIAMMDALPAFQGIDWKTSKATEEPFGDLLLRVSDEIVAIELPADKCDVKNTGVHLKPEEFHAAQAAANPEDIAIIDVRNSYEYKYVAVGWLCHLLS